MRVRNIASRALSFFMICGAISLGFEPVSASSSQEPVPRERIASDPAAELQSLRVVPQEITLWGKDASQRFLVLGGYSDGLERDVTGKSQLSVADTGLAAVDQQGRIRGLADGETTFRVEVDGQSAMAPIRIREAQVARPFSFARDIGGILTKRGCNTSECHGGVKGRGGYKLSLSAFYPAKDYQWTVEGGVFQVLTTESKGPPTSRINPDHPEKSLLLLKPTLGSPHAAGKRFAVDSPDYRTLHDWISGGAPWSDEGGPEGTRIERVEIFPSEGVLRLGEVQRLLVTAHLSNGRREDLTDQTLYVSNNSEVVEVGPDGIASAVRLGETSIMARTAGHTVSARFGVIADGVADPPESPRHNFIDDYVFAKLRRFNILPSGLSSDQEFLRRVCLDLTGTLPPAGRVKEFAASSDRKKRQKLVQLLLDSPEFLDYWTFRFGEIFRIRSNGQPEHGYAYWRWLRGSLAGEKPYDQMVRERISAQGFEGATRHYPVDDPIAADLMAESVRAFMGRRLDCAQCHDHPFEDWSQNQFWGLAAFFGKLSRTEWPGFGAAVMFDDPAGPDPDYGEPPESTKVIHPRTKKLVYPTFLDGRALSSHEQLDPRLGLAKWMTSHPYFAEATANRIWSYFFGRGLVEPVDDFRSTNPATHPDLLRAIANDFRENGYDLKHLLARITGSRTYQLSSVPNPSNEEDLINYSHHDPRLLDAEVLLDAISEVTGVPEEFENSMGGKAPPGTRAIQLRNPDLYPSRFLEEYGRPSRDTLPERNSDPSLGQALHLLAGFTYTEKLTQPGSRLGSLLAASLSDREIIDEFYLVALSRSPTENERHKLAQLFAARSSRVEAFTDFLWALIASREFAYNH